MPSKRSSSKDTHSTTNRYQSLQKSICANGQRDHLFMVGMLLLCAATPAHAAYTTVYTLPYSNGTGYYGGSLAGPPGGPPLNASGNVVTSGYSNSNGHVPVEFNTNGATQLAVNSANPNLRYISVPQAISDSNYITGTAYVYDVSGGQKVYEGADAVRWDPVGNFAVLGNLGSDANGLTSSSVYGINNAGTIIGYAQKYDSSHNSLGDRAVEWTTGSAAPIELQSLGTGANGQANSWGYVINNSGIAAGVSADYLQSPSGINWAVRWDAAGNVTKLDTLGATTGGSSASGINDASQIAGAIGTHAARWDAAGNAQVLPAPWAQASYAVANVINQLGATTGSAEMIIAGHDYGPRGVTWDATGTPTGLAVLSSDSTGHGFSQSWALNDAASAVGHSGIYGPSGSYLGTHAVWWSKDGTAHDLNSLIDPASSWVLTDAYAINDAGWITGTGTFDPDGPGGMAPTSSVFLIQVPAAAVPEPAGLVLAAAGAAGLLWHARRRGMRGIRGVSGHIIVARILWTSCMCGPVDGCHITMRIARGQSRRSRPGGQPRLIVRATRRAPAAEAPWGDDGWASRSAFRQRFEPARRAVHIGFRVVAVQP
jgi:hypothetical protein